jgi:hypothetical protein
MQLSFLRYPKNSMLPTLSAPCIMTSRRTRTLLPRRHPRKVYFIIHSTSSSRLCSSKHNKVSSNKRVALREPRRAPLCGPGVITRNINCQGEQFAMLLQVAAEIIPRGPHVIPVLAHVHMLSNRNNLNPRSQLLPPFLRQLLLCSMRSLLVVLVPMTLMIKSSRSKGFHSIYNIHPLCSLSYSIVFLPLYPHPCIAILSSFFWVSAICDPMSFFFLFSSACGVVPL